MTLNGHSMGSGDPSAMRQVDDPDLYSPNAIVTQPSQGSMALTPDFMSEVPGNRARKRDWAYGSIEGTQHSL